MVVFDGLLEIYYICIILLNVYVKKIFVNIRVRGLGCEKNVYNNKTFK